MTKAMQLKSKMKEMALKNNIPAQAVLQNFMLERLLERITVSKYKDIFILKGGMLIASMIGIGSRTTMDMDATLRGYPLSDETIRAIRISKQRLVMIADRKKRNNARQSYSKYLI